MFQHQVEEDADRFFVVAHAVVDQIEVRRQKAHGLWVQQGAGAERFFKDAQHVHLIGKKCLFIRDRQAVLFDRIRRTCLATAGQQPLQHWLWFCVLGL